MDDTKNWPSWRYAANGDAKVFNSQDEVPKGWLEHPSLHGKAPAAPAAAATTAATAPVASTSPAVPAFQHSDEVDRDGHPWSAELHASSKTRTKDDLWRMKVGVKRPAPLEGFPKPLLDL